MSGACRRRWSGWRAFWRRTAEGEKETAGRGRFSPSVGCADSSLVRGGERAGVFLSFGRESERTRDGGRTGAIAFEYASFSRPGRAGAKPIGSTERAPGFMESRGLRACQKTMFLTRLALPLGELSPQVTERALQPFSNDKINLCAHTTEIPVDIPVGESQNLQPKRHQELRTFRIVSKPLGFIIWYAHGLPSPSSLRSATSPKGRGKGCSHGTPKGV